jgi:hypothetical protein
MHLPNFSDRAWRWLGNSHLFDLLSRLGYRAGTVGLRIVVANDMLISDDFLVEVDVPEPSSYGLPGPTGYGLAMSVRSQPSLRSEQNDLSYGRQMAEHPDYFVGRPGGCEGCMVGWVSFVPHLSEEEHAHLSNFQLNCFTRLVHTCQLPEDLLPAVSQYHLYGPYTDDAPWRHQIAECKVSPNALGRDALYVLVVDTLSKRALKLPPEPFEGYADAEYDKARVVEILKGKLPELGLIITVMPFPGDRYDGLGQSPEHLEPNSRSILIWQGDLDGGVMELGTCGVIQDNPQNRAEVMSGISQYAQFQAADMKSYPSLF